MTFMEYIKSLRKINFEDKGKHFHVVLGNESCDLDSAICSLVTGYYLSKTENNAIAVPMLSIPRSDFGLKTEVRYLLDTLDIKADSLLFLDDVNIASLHEASRLKVTLVDHNVLPRPLALFEEAVIRVIDHHKWERNTSENLDVHWAETGSCATLVGKAILSTRKDIIDSTVASLLQAAIIVDTVNFSNIANKFRPDDVDVFNQLMSEYTPHLDWQAEYAKLKKAKEDISSLSVGDILRKDLKVVREKISIAVPSVPASLDVFLALENVDEELERFRKLKNVDSIVVMTSKFSNDELKRCLIILGKDAAFVDAIAKKLTTHEDPSLQLKPIERSAILSTSKRLPILILQQDNIHASRKVVLPLLKEFASSYE